MEDDQVRFARASRLASVAVAAIRLLPRGRSEATRLLCGALRVLGIAPIVRRRIGPYKLTFDLTERYEAMMALGVYEPEFVEIMRRVLRPGDTYVDAGTQLGYFAAEAGRRLGRSGRMLLFEPDPRPLTRLESHLASARASRVPHTKLFRDALSDHAGTGQLGLQQVVGWSQVVRSESATETISGGEVTSPTAEIRLTTLDAVIEAEQVEQVRLLKIDVEGHEVFLLRGARFTLDKVRPDYVLIEVNPDALAGHGYLGRHIHAVFAHYGYRGVRMPQARIRLGNCDPEGIVNFFYARTEALLAAGCPGLPPAVPENEFTAEDIEAAWLEANDDHAPDVRARRLVSMATAGRLAEAIAGGERLLEDHPDRWWFRGHLAHWLLHSGQTARARAHYERMLAEQPASAEVARILADLDAGPQRGAATDK